MSKDFELTPEALDDLYDIWSFIAVDSIASANRVEAAILSACSRLAAGPLQGVKRKEVTSDNVRFWTVSRYPNFIVVYAPDTDPLLIVAVLHGKRNLPPLLSGPGSR